MILIVGLGNPGKNYEKTRHNVGFLITSLFQKDNLLKNFRKSIKFNALISTGFIGHKKIILLQPQTYMNNSGQSVMKAAKYYKIKPENIWIIHDEVDLKFGHIKITQKAGSAGHNGIKSIINLLGTKDFVRFRIGVKNEKLEKMDTEKFVLKNFTGKELKALSQEISPKVNDAIKLSLTKSLEKAMNEINKTEK